MITYSIANLRLHTKEGINKEQCLSYHLTSTYGKHDNLKWNEGSDIPERSMSVKSAKFSLCTGGQLKGESITEMLIDYFARVASTVFAYVTSEYRVYEMNANEFAEFLTEFTYLTPESGKNNGQLKIKAKSESKKMLQWFQDRVA